MQYEKALWYKPVKEWVDSVERQNNVIGFNNLTNYEKNEWNTALQQASDVYL